MWIASSRLHSLSKHSFLIYSSTRTRSLPSPASSSPPETPRTLALLPQAVLRHPSPGVSRPRTDVQRAVRTPKIGPNFGHRGRAAGRSRDSARDDGAGSIDEHSAGTDRRQTRSHRAESRVARPVRSLSPIGRSASVRRRNGRFGSREMGRRAASNPPIGETGGPSSPVRGELRRRMCESASHGLHREAGRFVHAWTSQRESCGYTASLREPGPRRADGAWELCVLGGGGGVIGAGKSGRGVRIAVYSDGETVGVGVALAGGSDKVLFREDRGVGEAVRTVQTENEV